MEVEWSNKDSLEIPESTAGYKSPIEIAHDLSNAVILMTEDEVMKAVYRVGVKVDKDELLRALVYDREQYKAGYLDGIENAITWIDTYCTDCDIGLRDNDATAIKKLLEDWREENEQEQDS